MERANANGGGSASGSASAARLERYQDEKRRIIDSCFSKADPDGTLVETYITHCKITEYSSHPSTPPPPDARTSSSEKPRVIIIAVRRTGRVRIHKSKENSNGTFSIGKTWNMDDMTRVESYTGPDAKPEFKEWAGTSGFTITLSKPYYWQTTADSEKKFFLASIIKIYRRYTNGRIPDFVNFDPQLLQELLSADGRRQQQGPQSSPGDPPSRSNTGSGPLPSPTPPIGRAMASQAGRSSPVGSIDSSRSAREQKDTSMRRLGAPNRSQDSVATSFRSDDGATAAAATASSAATSRFRAAQPLPKRSLDSPESSQSFATPLTRPVTPQPRPTTPQIHTPQPQPKPQSVPPQDEQPPERRRPPMDPARPSTAVDRDLVPAPLATSVPNSPARQPGVAIPPRSMERTSRQNSVDPQMETESLASIKNSLLRKNSTEPPPLSNATSLASIKSSLMNRNAAASSSRERVAPIPVVEPPMEMEPQSSPEPEPEPSVSSPPVASPPATDSQVGSPLTEDDGESRPGLGPMIKSKKSKNDLSSRWRAATAAATAAATSIAAFKPRPGGAGEKLRLAKTKLGKEPDGITGVVPAPRRPVATPEPGAQADSLQSDVPQLTVTVPNASRPSSVKSLGEGKGAQDTAQTEEAARAKEEARRDVVVGNDAKYLTAMGIDPSILDGRSTQFGHWLDYFGWVPSEQMRAKNMDEVKLDIEREINRAQAGGWLARFREEDERVHAIKKGIDVAMTECDELDNLLTLYSVELSTLSDDIAYIEAQGQGLQVQTANQKLLKRELESLLETCAITSDDLDALRDGRLDNTDGLEEIEGSLVTLFKAMIKIDPSRSGNELKKSDLEGEEVDNAVGLLSDYGNMRIVQEKKEMYLQQGSFFVKRLVEFMARQFDDACAEVNHAVSGAPSKRVDASHHDTGRQLLWKYSPLMLYAREVDLESWHRLIQVYQDRCHPMYRSEFRDCLGVWKNNKRTPTTEDADPLFTSQAEKREEKEMSFSAARKLTVKRSQNLARGIRNQLQDGGSRPSLDKPVDNRSHPYEIFGGAIADLLPLVEMEQNFIIDFFHATTLEHMDFPDCVQAAKPQARRGTDLRRARAMEPDRELARRVTRAMEVVFSFLEQELQNLMEWVLEDPLQGVGVLAVLDRKLAAMGRSNQDFLNSTLQKLHGHLDGKFMKFVDGQITAIEETKIQIHKRKGVISFFRIFPAFFNTVENMLDGMDQTLGVRRTVNGEYDRILKAMFDKLKAIARDTSVSGGAVPASAQTGDEDKEAINYHILFIENMNHFIDETDQRGLEVLRDWRRTASTELSEHMELYLAAVIRRPLGKLLDFIENIEAQLASGKSGASIAAQPSNAKQTFNKVMGQYEAKEVRKGIEALRKRVEKHFGDADEPGPGGKGGTNTVYSQSLVNKVLRECDRFYADVDARINDITTNVYDGETLWEWPRAEAKNAFAAMSGGSGGGSRFHV